MAQQPGAPPAFCTCPPSCLQLLDDQKVGFEKAQRTFSDEAGGLQTRLREQLLQVKTEVGVFLRLMYKNKNQHRRSLYYRRLSEVRRDLQMLCTSGLEETVEAFPTFLMAGRPDRLLPKAATRSKVRVGIDERKALCVLLGVARLLNQIDGPILAASVHITGLLAQSFFVPFALTMFSSLARFRLLLIQILYEVITAFNLLSASLRQSKSASVGVMFHSVPVFLECQWDGVKLCMTEKKPRADPEGIVKRSDTLAGPTPLWFIDDRTGVTCDLKMAPISAGGKRFVTPHITSNVHRGTIMVPGAKRVAIIGPVVDEALPDVCRSGSVKDVRPSPEDLASNIEANNLAKEFGPLNLAPDLLIEPAITCSGAVEDTDMNQPPIQAPDSLPCIAVKERVAYISISHKIIPDSMPNGRVGQQLPLHAVRGDSVITSDKQVAMVEGSKVASSTYDKMRSKDMGTTDLTELCLLGDGDHCIPSSISARSLESGTSEQDVGKQDARHAFIQGAWVECSDPEPTQLDENEKRKQCLTCKDGANGASATADGLRAMESFCEKETVNYFVKENVEENSCIIQTARSKVRTKFLYSDCNLDSTVVDMQAKGSRMISQEDGFEDARSATAESQWQEETTGNSQTVAVAEAQSSTFGLNGPLPSIFEKNAESCNILPFQSMEGANAASHNFIEKVELKEDRDQVMEHAKEELRVEVEHTNVDKLAANLSVICSPRLAAVLEAGPGPSPDQDEGQICHKITGLAVQDALPKKAVAYISNNPGLVSEEGKPVTTSRGNNEAGHNHHSNGQKSGNFKQAANAEELRKNAKKAKSRLKRKKDDFAVCDVIRPHKKRKKDAKEKVVRERMQQLQSEWKDTPIKSVMKKGNDDNKDIAPKSESKKKIVDDIFAMLIGGSG